LHRRPNAGNACTLPSPTFSSQQADHGIAKMAPARYFQGFENTATHRKLQTNFPSPSAGSSSPEWRALPSEGRGREFESRRVRPLNQWIKENASSGHADRGSTGEACGTISEVVWACMAARDRQSNQPVGGERFFRRAVSSNLAGWLCDSIRFCARPAPLGPRSGPLPQSEHILAAAGLSGQPV
jgi:hypothetical protein